MNPKNIRNFAIIAHIDHGKSTLADRFLELTETVSKNKINNQHLDQNPISRERGITIKLAPVRMKYKYQDQEYFLNLIDTPGHVDFSYEVSRTLAACEGAIVLVDATQGVQAQTVAHFNTAKKEGLILIPVINKIDLPSAKIDDSQNQMVEIFGFNKEEILKVSAKTGENIDNLLKNVIEKIPSPKISNNPTRALVFDALYDDHRGVIVYVKLVDGGIKKGDKIIFYQSEASSSISELGFFAPELTPKDSLNTGEIGYLVTGIKDIKQTGVGDTIVLNKEKVTPLSGYKKPKPMIFFGLYPKTSDNIVRLKEALNKLSLNDNSLTFSEEYSSFLGSGFRVGFLGLLHADIVKERLTKEENVDLLLTMPQVLYEVRDGEMFEPYMKLIVFVPSDFVGAVMNVCQRKRGKLISMNYYGTNTVLEYEMPYSMLIAGLSSNLKTVSEGFATIDYELTDYKKADLKRIEILINGISVDVLSEYSYPGEAPYKAREKASFLKNSLPRQQFRQVIQALVDGQIISREEIPPFRKDVLAKMSGGDRTRKDKLLESQKKGKEKISGSKVILPQEVLFSLIEKN